MISSEQHKVSQGQFSRAQILERLGVNPYPHEFERSCSLLDVLIDLHYVGKEGSEVALKLCGRVSQIRAIGKSRYIILQDKDSELQFFLSLNSMSAEGIQKFDACIQQGDWIGFKINRLYRMTTGELTAQVAEWYILSPCLTSLPEAEQGRAYELQRYLQLAGNPTSRKAFVARSNATRFVRRFLEEQYGFLEVKTPSLQPQPSSVDGNSVEVHLEHAKKRVYLRHSAKPYHKQLIIASFDAVYEIGESFHDQRTGWLNHWEMQVLEGCLAPADLNDVMNLLERLFTELMSEQNRTLKVVWESFEQLRWRGEQRTDREADQRIQSHPYKYSEPVVIDFTVPWQRRSVFGLVQEATGVDFLLLKSVDEALEAARAVGIEIGDMGVYTTVGAVAVRILDELIIPTLVQPMFVVDHPFEESVTAKRHRHDPRLAESFELVINGLRIANGQTEQNDPREQVQQLLKALKDHDEDDLSASDVYTDALNYGLPPTGSLRIYLDRLTMLLTSTDDIRDTLFAGMFG